MTTMKKHIILTVLLTFAVSGHSFAQTVQGRITGVPYSTKIGVARVEGSNIVAVDTLDIDAQGNFSFESQVSKPTMFLLSYSGIKQITTHLMLHPKDKVSIELNYDVEHNYVNIVSTKGSKDLELYRQFNQILSRNNIQAQSLNNEFVFPSTTEERKREISNEFLQLQSSQNIEVRKLLENNASTLVSAFLVTYFDNDFETYYELYETILQSLNKKYADNQFVQYVDSKVKSSLGPGRMAPEIAMKDPEGKERKLSDLRGKVVMIDFWASWCRPCRMENPNVVKLYNKYHDKGFEVYSVSLDKKHADWVKAIEQDGLVWENHVSDLKGWTSSGGASYGITSVPSTVLVDRQGRIIARNLRGEELARKLREIFGE